LKICIEIVYRKIDVIRIGFRVPRVAVRPRIEAGENNAASREVMPSRGDPNSWLLQDRRVKDHGIIDICHRKDHAE
jgi:hypothetical protein